MESPKCRICLHNHWGYEDHVFASSEPEVVEVEGVFSEDAVEDAPRLEGEPVQRTGQVARNQRWREKNREKYNAYMREYRRKRK